MAQFPGEPNTYDFGTEFNYSNWTPETRLTLVNVSWNNDYRDIVDFSNGGEVDGKAALEDYINSIEGAGVVINNVSYVKGNQPIRIDIPFNSALKYNYLRAVNPLQPVSPTDTLKPYYYFITDVRYIAPNTTEIVVQLDVWNTYGYDVEFGSSYVERGHIGIANEKSFDNYGRDYLTVPEGLDTGGEYLTVAYKNEPIMNTKQNAGGPGTGVESLDQFRILIVTTVDLFADPGTPADPKLETATGAMIQGLPSGANVYTILPAAFTNLMTHLQDKPWISQGIISITAVPFINLFGYTQTLSFLPGTTIQVGTIDGYGTKYRQFSGINDWRTSSEILDSIPERYRSLKKLLTAPYMIIEITMWNGKPLILKPESWANDDSVVLMRPVFLPPHLKLVITPRDYNAKAGATKETWIGSSGTVMEGDDGGDHFDTSTVFDNFPQFSIVNNMGIAYLAANRNMLSWQAQSADWAQQRALRGNEVSYDQATSGMNLANELTGIGVRADLDQTNLNNQLALGQAIAGGVGGIVGGAGNGAVGGAMAGGPIGAGVGAGVGALGGVTSAVMGGVGAAMQISANSQGQAIRAAAANASNRQQQGNSGFIRDTNKSLADWAARGDYEQSIAGLNAKVQDTKLTQPSVSAQAGGEAFNMIHNAANLSIRYKMIDPAAIAVVGEYFLRYGYAVRRFTTITSLKMMSKFTYWKLSETYIISARMPEGFKQAIRGIFEKGVTVWVNPEEIGAVDFADNEPVEGITI